MRRAFPRTVTHVLYGSALLLLLAGLVIQVAHPLSGYRMARLMFVAMTAPALAWAIVTLALALVSRRLGNGGWWWALVPAAMSLTPIVLNLAPPLHDDGLVMYGHLLFLAGPIALVFAALGVARARGKPADALVITLAVLPALLLGFQVLRMSAVGARGPQDFYAHNMATPLPSLALLVLLVVLAVRVHGRSPLAFAGLVVALVGAAVASGSMGALVALDGLRPFGGIEQMAFALFGLGNGIVAVSIVAAAYALAGERSEGPPSPPRLEEDAWSA